MFALAMSVMLALVGQKAEMALYHDGYPTVASGSINVEVRSMDGIRKRMQELVRSDSAVSKSYSEYTNNRGKKSINASYEVKKSSAVSFMDEIGRMGRVQSKNYNDQYNPGQNIGAYQRRLGAYRTHLKRLLSSPGADPDIVSLLDQQIQSLESQIESMKRSLASAGDRATISVQISESGYNQGHSLPAKPVKLLAIAGLVLMLLGLLIGLLIGRLAGRGKA